MTTSPPDLPLSGIFPPDGVWQSLDRDAGRMPRRLFATAMAAVTIVGVLAAAGLIGWRSGILWPNVARENSHAGWSVDTGQRAFEITFPVRNNGLVPVDITSFGRDGHGLTLTDARINDRHLASGATTEIVMAYRVTDCDTFQTGRWPVPFQVSHGRVAYVDGPPMERPDAPSSYSYTTGRDPYAMPWQEKLAAMACGRISLSA